MSTLAMLEDYLFVGTQMQLRLKEAMPDLLGAAGAVQGVDTYVQAAETTIAAPTAFVLWEGDTFDGIDTARAAGGRSQALSQQWTVVLVVRNADQYAPDGRSSVAGQYLAGIHKAIAGWMPPGAARPMLRMQGRKPSYGANAGAFPLTFSIQLHL